MNRRRAQLLVALIVGFTVVASAAWLVLPRGTDSDAVLVEMVEFAAQPSSTTVATTSTSTVADFPAITDSAIRDPEERVAPSAATLAIIETIAHDTSAFTQGFELDGERLYEGTGLVGASTLREVDPSTGDVLRSIDVDHVFGEGVTIVDDEIIQLTWKDEVAFRYDVETFALVETHAYDGEGWGLCDDGDRLVMSDGSPTLTFRDRETFAVLDRVDVTYNGAQVERLNELECVGGTVWANIWRTPLIIEIDPADGHVLTVIDAGALRPESTVDNSDSVLNGIAFDATDGTWLLTGKRWPVMYRVEVIR